MGLTESKPRRVELFCDGASRGNPGPSSYGFVVLEGGTVLDEAGDVLGVATNNVAEYQGLLHGLRRCLELGATQVVVKCDSELMVRQLSGQYKVKSPNLLTLHQEAKGLLKRFQAFDVRHVRREENSRADALANLALDRARR